MMTLPTVSQMVVQNSAKFANEIAFQIKRDGIYQRITYGEAFVMVKKLATKLYALGIRKGDRVALLGENRPEWAISYLAIIYAGAVVVPLDALGTPDMFENFLKDSSARGVILSGQFLETIDKIKGNLHDLKFMIDMDHNQDGTYVLSFRRAVTETNDSRDSYVEASLDDLVAILYTSGTTGVAKGVMLTHRNIMSNVEAVYQLFEVGTEDNFLSVLPLHHTFECTGGFLCPFYIGAKITYAEGLKSYLILSAMQETGVTIMLGVPLLYRLFYEGMMREVSNKGLVVVALFAVLKAISNFIRVLTGKNIGKKLFGMIHKKLGGKTRFWVAGAAAMDPVVMKGFQSFGVTILQGYGLTESSPVISACTLEKNRIGSVGLPIPEVEVKIVNPDKEGIGEIIARGPNIMKGYYRRQDLTDGVLKEGWLYTGDLGRLDQEGYLYITGRSKNIIVTGSGINVYPEEIEVLLNRNPFIKEACILGMKLAQGVRRGMEEVMAVVVPDQEYFEKYLQPKGVTVTKAVMEEVVRDEIRKLNEQLSEYKRIAQIRLRDEDLPKTSTRKVKRFELRKELKV